MRARARASVGAPAAMTSEGRATLEERLRPNGRRGRDRGADVWLGGARLCALRKQSRLTERAVGLLPVTGGAGAAGRLLVVEAGFPSLATEYDWASRLQKVIHGTGATAGPDVLTPPPHATRSGRGAASGRRLRGSSARDAALGAAGGARC